MLQVFRESVGRYVAIAILALIAVTFVFFGIDFSITQLSFAAKVDGEVISVSEFDRRLRREQTLIQQNLRIELTDDIRRQIRQELIDEMVMRKLLHIRAEEAGYRISDGRLMEIIRSDPAFQAGGQFSQDVYVSLVTGDGLTPAGYEASQREVYTITEWQDGLVSSSFVTPAEFRRFIELEYERREIAWAMFAADDFREGIEVSDEEVAAYHAENGDLFRTEEAVDIEFVELDLADIAATINISDEELRRYYEDEIERYAVSEERSVRHILIEPEGDDYVEAEAEAEAVVARLEAGEDFAAVAAEVSDDAGTRNLGGDLGYMARGVFPAPFEDALYAMQVGEIEGPIETEFGFHVIRLDDIRATDPQPFDAVRDQLRQELASDRAYSGFYDRANDLANDAYDARDNLQTVAETFGLELQTVERLTRSGSTDLFIDPTPIVAVAFDDEAIASGENSDLIELSDERVAVIRVAAHYLPEPEPLEAVADEIRELLVREAAEDRAGEAATAFFDALSEVPEADKLAEAEALAAEHGGSWTAPTFVGRDSTLAPPSVISLAFAQPRPADGDRMSLLRAFVGNGDEAVVVLTRAQAGLPEDVAPAEREQRQAEFAELSSTFEMNAYAADARARASVRVPEEVLDPQL
jgi:peptidyl-prolyl cis-trans isomerase D